jgi:hypothetical protein
MEQCYIKTNKLLSRALMLFVIKDGKLCIFIDYHVFFKNAIKSNYPLPWIDNLFDHLCIWGLLLQLSGFEVR